jgi:prepilin-type N-terminal cleavage/methylation domain-containing protein
MEISKLTFRRQRHPRGYTLVEVLIASSILAMGISAACALSLAMVTQEEMTHRLERSVNLHENAARLYQLGLDGATINAIRPANDDLVLVFTPSEPVLTDPLTGSLTVDAATITATVSTTDKGAAGPTRTQSLTAFRSKVR